MTDKRRILIVDDDRFSAEAVARPLASAGYEVTTLDSGAAAMDWLDDQTADLVILDVMMPGLSGFDVCRRLRQRDTTRTTPVILLSARKELAAHVEGTAAGGDMYLTKPVLANRLLAMVDMFLSSEAPLARRHAGVRPS